MFNLLLSLIMKVIIITIYSTDLFLYFDIENNCNIYNIYNQWYIFIIKIMKKWLYTKIVRPSKYCLLSLLWY